MTLECKLIKKTFKNEDGQSHEYYALEFTLADGTTLDVTIKKDKAQILTMSYNLTSKNDRKPSFLK